MDEGWCVEVCVCGVGGGGWGCCVVVEAVTAGGFEGFNCLLPYNCNVMKVEGGNGSLVRDIVEL